MWPPMGWSHAPNRREGTRARCPSPEFLGCDTTAKSFWVLMMTFYWWKSLERLRKSSSVENGRSKIFFLSFNFFHYIFSKCYRRHTGAPVTRRSWTWRPLVGSWVWARGSACLPLRTTLPPDPALPNESSASSILVSSLIFAENCMKMKEGGLRGGASLVHPLVLRTVRCSGCLGGGRGGA